MFGGKKKQHERDQQIRAEMLAAQQQAGQPPAPGGNPSQTPATHGHHTPGQAMIEAVLRHNPALAGNPALAASMGEMIREARADPQAFRQRMRDLAAAAGGATAFTLGPEGLTPVGGTPGGQPAGQGFPQSDPPQGHIPTFGPPTQEQPPPASSGVPSFGPPQQQPPPPPPGRASFGPAPQPPPPAAPAYRPPSPIGGSGHSRNPLAELDKLSARFNRGELTSEQFEAEKRRVLGS
jgi:Short C-terminal domain